MDYTSLLGPLMLVSSWGASRDEVEKMRKEIETMVREHAAQSESSEEDETSQRKHRLRPRGRPSRECRDSVRNTRQSQQQGGRNINCTHIGSAPRGRASRNCCDSLRDTRHPQQGGHRRRSAQCKGALNDVHLRRINPLAYTTERRIDFGHNGERISSFESFDHAARNPDYKGFSEEGKGSKISIPNNSQDAIKSPQPKQRSKAVRSEMAILKEHVYELVPIHRVPNGQKIIGSRFVFKQKAGGRFKALLTVRGYSQEAGIDCGKTFGPVYHIGASESH